MKNKLQFIPACIVALALCAPAALAATPRALPFKGVIASVDQVAKTFTIAGKEKSRVFQVTDKTALTKGGAAVTMKDVVANEEVRGSYVKLADGTLEVKTAKLGPMTEEEKAAASKGSKKKAKKDEASSEGSSAASPTASPSASPKP